MDIGHVKDARQVCKRDTSARAERVSRPIPGHSTVRNGERSRPICIGRVTEGRSAPIQFGRVER